MWFLNLVCPLALLTIVSCDVRDEVKFFLSTQYQNRTELTYDNLNAVNVENPIIVLIHGYSVGSNVTWVIELTELLLEQYDYNIIAVDYAPIAKLDYISAVVDARAVAEYTGELIVNLYANYSANLSDFQVIAHSLGGQIAGLAGKAVQRLTGLSVGRITALDPAGPFYFPTDPYGRLNGSDANIVVTLHTDGLGYGWGWLVGGIDFYANGGNSPQPGCLLQDFTTNRCSHNRAYDYYLEAVRNPNGFVATECSNYIVYEFGFCSGNENITLGGNFTQNDYGIYFFNTNSQSPYSKQ